MQQVYSATEIIETNPICNPNNFEFLYSSIQATIYRISINATSMKFIFKTALLAFFLINISCTKTKIGIDQDYQVNNFVWSGLNAYYLWQDKVTNLSDARFLNMQEYNSFLGTETNTEVFFENLLHQKDVVDKWSWIVDDYIALEQAFQGITKHHGMEFGLVAVARNETDIFGYVRYVLPNSDAADKNVQRGMLFNAVNGTKLTRDNYGSLLFASDSYTIDLADFTGGNLVGNGTSIALTKSAYQENPVFISKTITSGTKKIGYLMYNAFTSNFDGQLNTAFSTLKASGITDLIVDLRYNGGGSIRTAAYLSSMITGQFTGELFSKNHWNSKVQGALSPENLLNNFTNEINNGSIKEAINSLQLTKVYFITTGSSASASELVINGLKPYIDVKIVGTKTHGKYVGSVTLYDSPNFSRTGASTEHTWAMQPIVLEVKNKLGENDKDGFDPDKELGENFADLGVLGELSDPLLQRTITYITTGGKGGTMPSGIQFEEITNSKLELPTRNNMYVEFDF